MSAPPIVAVRDLVKHFPVHGDAYGGHGDQVVHAVDGVSFAIAPGETLALVGEDDTAPNRNPPTVDDGTAEPAVDQDRDKPSIERVDAAE